MSGHAVPPPPPATPVPLGGRRVLVVEDEALVAMLVEDELRAAGAEVVVAAALAEALRLVRAEAIGEGLSAAVLDIDLCGKAVLPVADALADLGVLFLFATGYAVGRELGLHAAAPVLLKPFEPQDLVATLEALMSAGPPRPRAPGRAPFGGASFGGETFDRGGMAYPPLASR